MSARARKKIEPRRGSRVEKKSATHSPDADSGNLARLRVRGLNVLAQGVMREKEKVSLTLDKPLVDEIRSQFGGRALSTSINELLYAALAQERLGELVDEMEQEAGAPSPEAYQRVLAQWFAAD